MYHFATSIQYSDGRLVEYCSNIHPSWDLIIENTVSKVPQHYYRSHAHASVYAHVQAHEHIHVHLQGPCNVVAKYH